MTKKRENFLNSPNSKLFHKHYFMCFIMYTMYSSKDAESINSVALVVLFKFFIALFLNI